MEQFELRTRIAQPPSRVWDWHCRPGAFERLTPPWERVRVIRPLDRVADGEQMELAVATPLGKRRWLARLRDVQPGVSFVDEQVRGPFRQWVHEHRFEPDDRGGTWMIDRISYALPWGPLGRAVAGGFTQRKLERVFRSRHERCVADLAAPLPARPLRIAVTGASGLVGSRLIPRLRTLGHDVLTLVRRAPRAAGEVQWDPERRDAELPLLEGTDVVIHLAGRNIADGRWTAKAKREIRESRVIGTENLVAALRKLERRPSVFLSASAVGIYGHRPDEACTEQSAPGSGYLADVCRAWETASAPLAVEAGMRLAHLRIGVVLAADGGALPKMLTPFRLGAGGVIGSGRQPVPWIAADDLVEIIVRATDDHRYSGPINCTAPPPTSNRDLTKALGRVLRRPTIAPLPAFVVQVLFGEMGTRLLLEGARVVPARLQGLGFEWRYPDLESALRFELGRPDPVPSGDPSGFRRATTQRLAVPPVRP